MRSLGVGRGQRLAKKEATSVPGSPGDPPGMALVVCVESKGWEELGLSGEASSSVHQRQAGHSHECVSMAIIVHYPLDARY